MEPQTVVKLRIKRAGGDRDSRDRMPMTRLRAGRSMVHCSTGEEGAHLRLVRPTLPRRVGT